MSLHVAPAESGRGVHLVLYDGVCGLCNSVCQFVLARDRRRAFDFASLQSLTGRAWLARFDRNPDDLDTVCLITDYRTTPALHVKSAAALAIAARAATARGHRSRSSACFPAASATGSTIASPAVAISGSDATTPA